MFQLFQFIDDLLPLSGTLNVCFWAALAGMLSMLLYRRFSPQCKLGTLMEKLQVAQQAMNEYDGEFDGLLPLLKTTIGLSMQRVWMSLVPSLIAAVPLVVIMICIGSQVDGQSPQQSVQISDNAELSTNAADPNLQNAVEIDEARDGFVSNSKSPTWMQSWIVVFVIVSSGSALAVRQWGGII